MTPNDPLFPQQWYLLNTGQNGGTPGMDIDVTGAWQYVTGKGVKIVVNDTGIDYTNPDLAPNYDAADSKSVDPPTNDGYPYNTDNLTGTDLQDLAHGTAVAGLIAAAGNDDFGIIGAAYQATIAAYRVIDTAAGDAAAFTELADAFNNEVTGGFAVANNSWEFTDPFVDSVFSSDPTVQSAINALLAAATNGRGGLGTINVFAAGNGYSYGDDTNLHAFQSSINVVTVAALDDNGTVNAPVSLGGRYSDTGATILVSAPGTDIVSDDMVDTPTNNGFATGDTASDLSGTSFAAPLVSGVIALMLEANPKLGLRDVQEILAYTARQNDPTDPTWSINDAPNWNGGGLHVSDDYGFGLVDARAAVALASTWTLQQTLSNRIIDTVSADSLGAIPADGATFTFTVPQSDLLNLQWVRVQLAFTYSAFDNIKIVLTSPTGAQSVLLDQPYSGVGGLNGYFDTALQLSTDQFWGQQSVGTWKVTIEDANTPGDAGIVTTATLVLVGDTPTQNQTYIYTDEYGAMLAQNAARGTLADTSGDNDTINLAATSGACSLDLATGVCSIDGSPLAITSGTIVKGAIGGAGATTITANGLGDDLQAGAGTTTLIGGAGNDTLTGGLGNDVFVDSAGSDTIAGGSGVNTLDLSNAPAAVTVNLAAGTVQNGFGGTDTISDIQIVKGSPHGTIFTGGVAATLDIEGAGNTLVGGSGALDTVDYSAAPAGITVDIVTGTVTGGFGGTDKISGSLGFHGTQFDDSFIVGSGGFSVDGGGGTNSLDLSAATAGVSLNLTTGVGQSGGDSFANIQDFKGTTFNDTFVAGPGTYAITGAGGHDLFQVHSSSSGYTLASDGNGGVIVTDGTAGRDGTTDLTGFNYIQFTDRLEVVATPGQAAVAVLYAAALGRIPDMPGLDGWEDAYAGVSAAAKGQGPFVSLAETPVSGLPSIAYGFINSPEFQQKYGSLSDTAYVTLLYQNVLDRAPDQPGLQGWLNAMATGGYTREMVLVGFAESIEFLNKVSGEWLFQT